MKNNCLYLHSKENMYGEEKIQGMNGLKHFFIENPSRFEELKLRVT